MKSEILAMLRETDDYVSGQSICEHFGVSRTAVWKAISRLKEAGYEIEAIQNRGYRLIGIPDILNEEELKSIRKTEQFGTTLFYFPVIDSTNTKAKQLAEEGFPHGTLIVADKQEAGRGRRGRGFESPAGVGIFMTLLLKPDLTPSAAPMLTLVAALAVEKAILNLSGHETGIKWPNDIVMNGKKICGILTEMSAQFDYINHIVIGIGVNVNNETFPDELSDIATSILLETGRRLNRASLIEEILEQFEYYYDIFSKTEDLSGLTAEYNANLINRNRKVSVSDPKEPFTGTAVGINDTGELLVETKDGRRTVSSGEVSVRGVYGYV